MASSEASSSSISPTTVTTERTPLLRTDTERLKPPRSVTFNPNPVTKTIFPEPMSLSSSPGDNGLSQATLASSSDAATWVASIPSIPGQAPTRLSVINSRLRRRNSHGGTVTSPAATAGQQLLPKIGPQRSTKNAQKLKLLPNPELEADEVDEESGREVYSQYTRIKDPTARRDAARLGKADREKLPRVTAYCTASQYQMEGLMRFLKGRAKNRGANPKLIDECLYTPYSYSAGKGAERAPTGEERERRESEDSQTKNTQNKRRPSLTSERRHSTGELTDLYDSATESGAARAVEYSNGRDIHNDLAYPSRPDDHEHDHPHHPHHQEDFDTHVHTSEVFLFAYGVVVIWGMTVSHEQRFLRDIAKFESEKLAADDVETECFNFYYTKDYQPRIYNDFITLSDKRNYMTKLAISHALAQSVKTSLFEELIASEIETCKDIPTQIATTGKIALSRTQINMQIGELFILRINIHLNGSVLDTPELFWVEPHLEPLYQAVRNYLEMDQRVGLLTERLDVIADLLAVLKDQLSHGHGEMLEWIVIILIAAEILVAAVNIVVDLYAGVD